MTTNNFLLIILLAIIFLIYRDNTSQKKTIKKENIKLKSKISENKLLLEKVKIEKEIEIERRKKELLRINMLEKRRKELAWRIELLTRLKYIRRLKRIRRRYHRGVYKRRYRRNKKVKKIVILKRK